MKSFIKKTLPDFLLKFIFEVREKQFILKIKNQHRKKIHELRSKDEIHVVFLVIHESVWKYDEVYRSLESNSRYKVTIVICPFTATTEEIMKTDLNKAFHYFKNNGYNVLNSLKSDNTWLDVKTELKPDIIFFSNPWSVTLPQYLIYNFKFDLTCYVPYFFHISIHLKENYNGDLQNYAWKVFYETNFQMNFAKLYARNKGSNAIQTGYPPIDNFIFSGNDNTKEGTKIIIWAPHHSIEGQGAGLDYSNFKKYYSFFIELIEKYSDNIVFVFKPHPLLKTKLYKDLEWGKTKTDNYYEKWNSYNNSRLADGNYQELFMESSAIIHDSSSFLVEYLATKKPAMYTMHDTNVANRLNEFGRIALKQHYLAFDENDIIQFIENVVLMNNDYMIEDRKSFVNQYLLPPNNRRASENIIEVLESIEK